MKENKVPCTFPDCPRTYVPVPGELPACPYHAKFMKDWVWAATHIQFQKPKTPPPTLIIPSMGIRGNGG